ncbi:hypothetical protein COO60DRAFT_1608205 [Scenedesmus sp. NREL 46B-D3]|nr:hypothetical protein COO60DRAFT_1608205 [Scenedesmus sp. NREL 46B-D3]
MCCYWLPACLKWQCWTALTAVSLPIGVLPLVLPVMVAHTNERAPLSATLAVGLQDHPRQPYQRQGWINRGNLQ